MDTVRENKGLLIAESIAFILLGAIAIAIPGLMTLGIELFIGWLFLIGGAVQTYRAITMKEAPGFYPSLFSGLVSIVLGIALLAYPITGVVSLTMLLIAFFAVEGVTKIFYAFQIKSSKGWILLLISGILGLALAGLLIAGWPGTAVWAIGLLVGINMLFFGFSLLGLVVAAKE